MSERESLSSSLVPPSEPAPSEQDYDRALDDLWKRIDAECTCWPLAGAGQCYACIRTGQIASLRAALPGLLAATREREACEPYFGCFTGDCPHNTQSQCDAAIRAYCADLERENAALAAPSEPIAWLIVRDDGSLCDRAEMGSRASAEAMAARYAANAGRGPYTVEPLYRAAASTGSVNHE
jgi:hypothetical protein